MSLFLREDGTLLALWRVLGHGVLLFGLHLVVLLALVAASIGGVAGYAGLSGAQPSEAFLAAASVVVSYPLLVAAAGGAHLASGLFLDGRFAGGFRWGRPRDGGLAGPALRTFTEVALGLVLGGVTLALAVLPAVVAGARPRWDGLTLVGAGLLALGVGTIVLQSTWEELVFRGYLAQWFARGVASLLGRVLGPTVSEVVGFALPSLSLGVVFGVAHIVNPSAGLLSTLNTVLAGLWLVVMVWRTRSLWAASAAHFSWNALMGYGLGMPLSGMTYGAPNSPVFARPLLSWVDAGPDWLTGGAYGPEGGVAATVALLLGTALALALPRRAAADGMSALRRPGSA